MKSFMIALIAAGYISAFDSLIGLHAAPGQSMYGPVAARSYLVGRFNPRHHPLFINAARIGIPANRRYHYLRRRTAMALLRMYLAFKKEHPRVPFRLISSTRTYYAQKSIWERKWKGRVRVEGNFLPRSHPNPRQRGRIILRYSSMPGTSRHHWGTDVDLTNLNNSYFERGRGAILFRWLERNANRYGFCRPYTAGRKRGYQEEKWHWSYRPLSAFFLKDWQRRFKKNPGRMFRARTFAGGRHLVDLAPVYVGSVDSSCR